VRLELLEGAAESRDLVGSEDGERDEEAVPFVVVSLLRG
jgi:hypothetical protein